MLGWKIGVKKLALHTCCAPCLLGVYDLLAQQADQVTAVYYNPNIAPVAEYVQRRDACQKYAQQRAITFVELEPDRASKELLAAESQQHRCQTCYDLRLQRVAAWAVPQGYDSVATTLGISPWQDLPAIARAGQAAVKQLPGVSFLSGDFRKQYRQAQAAARDVGIYRQNYCGCLPSKKEAQEQRATRRAQRTAEKMAEKSV